MDKQVVSASEAGPMVPALFGRELLHRRISLFLVATVVAVSTLITPAGRDRLVGWVQVAQAAFEPSPIQSVFVSMPTTLSPEQARAARWLAKRYRVSLAATEQIVQLAFAASREKRVDPYLLLAVISVESAFNPLAESHVGAKGLMQVMPHMHRERFDAHGGISAALDPQANIRVGADILREYLDRFQTLEAALSAYVGVGPNGITEYPTKVLTLRDRIAAAAMGRVLALAD